MSCVQSWDTAIKATHAHDASACATFVEREEKHYLIDMLVVRLEYPALRRLIVTHAERFAAEAVLIEDAASGQSLLQDLRSASQLPLIGRHADADKLTRLVRVSPIMEAGQVALPKEAPWLHAFEEELLGFPDAVHDDQVDAFSQYLNWVRERKTRGKANIRHL